MEIACTLAEVARALVEEDNGEDGSEGMAGAAGEVCVAVSDWGDGRVEVGLAGIPLSMSAGVAERAVCSESTGAFVADVAGAVVGMDGDANERGADTDKRGETAGGSEVTEESVEVERDDGAGISADGNGVTEGHVSV